MSWAIVLGLGLAWLGVAVALLFGLHRRTLAALWREPMLACPVLIVESDDWGVGPLSDGEVLARIASVLQAVQDRTGQPSVMTLGMVLGHPDGPAILASGCQRYRRHTIAEPAFAPIVEAIRRGLGAGVFALQRHGLEHCWPPALLARARRDSALREWLADPAARSEALPPELQSRWVDAATLPSRPIAPEDLRQAVEEEARLFEQLWGAAPPVAVPNTFVWSAEVERAWAASGVRCVVTPGRRHHGCGPEGALLTAPGRIRNGERSPAGPLFVVRDDYFESCRGHRAERVWQALADKTRAGRPTLLETHRESFILPGAAGQGALEELARALAGAKERFPQLRFMSTEVLASHLVDPASPLCLQAGLPRLGIYLARLQGETDLHRLLKWTGLKAVLVLLRRVQGTVTGLPSERAGQC